jgi:hypothetical protein
MTLRVEEVFPPIVFSDAPSRMTAPASALPYPDRPAWRTPMKLPSTTLSEVPAPMWLNDELPEMSTP